MMKVEVVDSISSLGAAEWNRLTNGHYPFLRHEFLEAAERSECVSHKSGWAPRHIAVFDDRGKLKGAMPLYEKTHSWGEFVFDWAWAHAYERAGFDYYPKLVSATPFTPASSPRLLLAERDDVETGILLAGAAIRVARELGSSSLHVQFPLPEELSLLSEAGLKLRKDCQFHWHNRDYRSFDDFLGSFSSAKRKKARRDRRHVAEQGIRFRWYGGSELDPILWQDIHQLVSLTFLRRGSMPYLSCDFFCEVSERIPESIAVVVAERHRQAIAAAIFYRSPSTLYGRYWGCDGHYNALHFETCYYQGIEFCIDNRIAKFEPGTQGEHKISRGFTPVTTWSAHWLAQPEFFDAIGRYLESESRHIESYIDAVKSHTPYRAADDRDGGDPDQ